MGKVKIFVREVICKSDLGKAEQYKPLEKQNPLKSKKIKHIHLFWLFFLCGRHKVLLKGLVDPVFPLLYSVGFIPAYPITMRIIIEHYKFSFPELDNRLRVKWFSLDRAILSPLWFLYRTITNGWISRKFHS